MFVSAGSRLALSAGPRGACSQAQGEWGGRVVEQQRTVSVCPRTAKLADQHPLLPPQQSWGGVEGGAAGLAQTHPDCQLATG